MAQRNDNLTQVDRLERELETQIKESYKEAGALRRKFDDDVSLIRRDADNRLAEHHRLAKKQQAKLKDRVASAEERKAHLRRRVEVLQQQLAVTTNELHLAKSQICALNAKVQNLRARPPKVVERADPGVFADAARLRDRASVMEQQARRAHEAACEAREAVGKEAARNQSFQLDLDNARHRLLTVQGSLAEALEENAGLRREIESERVKSAEGSRRLSDAVKRHDAALDEVRRESLQLRAQRDSFAQDHAALGVKLRQIEKRNGATRIFNVLNQVRFVSLAGALRTWEVSATKAICSRQQIRQQEKHNSELASLEAHLRNAETLCKIARREHEALRDSRERVAEAVATVGRRRGGMAAAAEERDGSALQLCFWGWARVAQRGEAAVVKKKERIDAQRALSGVRVMLAAAVDRAREAETERDRQSATVQMLADEIKRSKEDLENIRVALEDTQRLSTACRNRFVHFVMVRLHKIIERNRQELLTHTFAKWFFNYHECALTEEPAEESVHPEPVAATDQAIVGQPGGRRRSFTDRNAQMLTETEAAEASTSTPAPSPGLGTSSNFVKLRNPSNSRHVLSTVTPLDAPNIACDDLLAGGPSSIRKQPRNNAGVVGTGGTPITSPRMEFLGEERVLQVPDVSSEDCVSLRTPKGQVIDSEEARFDAQGVEFPNASTSDRQGYPLSSSRRDPRAVIEDVREHEQTNGNCTVYDRGACTETPITTRSPRGEPLGDRISIAAAKAPDSPRLILAMRMALGEELYDVGERLMRCVEADHQEMHGRPYRPIPLTDAEREQFHACLVDASRGTLRRGVITLLRAQDSDRAVAEERGQADTKTTYSCNGDRVQWKDQSCGRGRGACEGGGARRMATFRGKSERLRNSKERRYDLSSLTIGPMSSPAEKAAAARLLRDRLVAILEDANEAWQSRRRTSNTFDFGIESGTLRFGRKTRFLTRGSARYSNESGHCERQGGLDSGAGPRKFWEAVTGLRFVEPSWNIEIEVLEEQIWKIATLVRDQDHHHQGLALGRSTHLRRILDLRMYELLLLHVRTRLIWDGMAGEVLQTTS